MYQEDTNDNQEDMKWMLLEERIMSFLEVNSIKVTDLESVFSNKNPRRRPSSNLSSI